MGWRSDLVTARLLRTVGCASGSCFSTLKPGISEGGMGGGWGGAGGWGVGRMCGVMRTWGGWVGGWWAGDW